MKRRYVLLAMTSVLAIALTVPALGGPSNPIAEGAASAKQTAKKALKKAKKAQQTANTAQQSANAAQSTANGAQNEAEEASAAAANAQTTANDAATAAATAQTAADAAAADAATKWAQEVRVEGDPTPTNSDNDKSNSVGCSGDLDPTGGGWIVTGAGSNDVTVNLTTQYGSGWIVAAQEVGAGTADTWALTVNAVCAGPST
jgi:membrane protein involved in colicin uptake